MSPENYLPSLWFGPENSPAPKLSAVLPRSITAAFQEGWPWLEHNESNQLRAYLDPARQLTVSDQEIENGSTSRVYSGTLREGNKTIPVALKNFCPRPSFF
jgi:hypothetical protein